MILGFKSPYCLNSFLYTATFFLAKVGFFLNWQATFPNMTMRFELNVCIVGLRVNKALLSKKLNS